MLTRGMVGFSLLSVSVFSYHRWENKQLCDSDGLCMGVFQKGGSPPAKGPGMSPKAFSKTLPPPEVLGWGLVCVLEKLPTHTISGTMPTF